MYYTIYQSQSQFITTINYVASCDTLTWSWRQFGHCKSPNPYSCGVNNPPKLATEPAFIHSHEYTKFQSF